MFVEIRMRWPFPGMTRGRSWPVRAISWWRAAVIGTGMGTGIGIGARASGMGMVKIMCAGGGGAGVGVSCAGHVGSGHACGAGVRVV
ncbi:hypothetical protein BGC30_13905 [Novacetimonas hansenii]|nr:hypothetical protein BGC30_13905 [Novacetimonas hansenii]